MNKRYFGDNLEILILETIFESCLSLKLNDSANN